MAFSIAFIGWFGPRGIASVLYLLIVVNELGLKGYERMLSVIVLAVLLSVFTRDNGRPIVAPVC